MKVPRRSKIISRVEIGATGRTNLTDLLRGLPEAGATGINEAAPSPPSAAPPRQPPRPRCQQHLILVNGRRTVATANASGGTVFVDLNRFPIRWSSASRCSGRRFRDLRRRRYRRRREYHSPQGLQRGRDQRLLRTQQERRWEKNFSLFAGAGSGRASATVAVSFFERGALKASDTTFGANADLSARYNNYGPQYIPLVTAGFYDLRSGTGPQARIAHRPRHRPESAAERRQHPRPRRRHRHRSCPVPRHRRRTLASATPRLPTRFDRHGRPVRRRCQHLCDADSRSPEQPSNLYNFQDFVWLTPECSAPVSTSPTATMSQEHQFYGEASYQHNKSHIELAPSPRLDRWRQQHPCAEDELLESLRRRCLVQLSPHRHRRPQGRHHQSQLLAASRCERHFFDRFDWGNRLHLRLR